MSRYVILFVKALGALVDKLVWLTETDALSIPEHLLKCSNSSTLLTIGLVD